MDGGSATTAVVAGAELPSAQRERWELVGEAAAPTASLVLAYQRLAWATALLDGAANAACVLVELPFPAMVQIAEYQHTFKPEAAGRAEPPSREDLLTEGFRCDAQDRHGDWYPAYVAETRATKQRETEEVLIHFVGWSAKFREWLNIEEQRRLAEGEGDSRLAPLGRFSDATSRRGARRWWLASDTWAQPEVCAEPGATGAAGSWLLQGGRDLRLLPACRVCNVPSDAPSVVLCEGCEASIVHTYCASPPMVRRRLPGSQLRC